MALLRYVQPCSVDLRVSDDDGDFSWAEPPESVHAFVNDLMRPIGTHVYGRRMWETMRFWESVPDEESVMGDFGRVWRTADKIVVSRSLDAVDTARSVLAPRFDADDLRRRKAAATSDLTIGGPTLAAAALDAGVVDEIALVVVPVVVGSGPRALPDGLRATLSLKEHRELEAGWTFVRYAVGRER